MDIYIPRLNRTITKLPILDFYLNPTLSILRQRNNQGKVQRSRAVKSSFYVIYRERYTLKFRKFRIISDSFLPLTPNLSLIYSTTPGRNSADYLGTICVKLGNIQFIPKIIPQSLLPTNYSKMGRGVCLNPTVLCAMM